MHSWRGAVVRRDEAMKEQRGSKVETLFKLIPSAFVIQQFYVVACLSAARWIWMRCSMP
jgi:hypothetical protein